MNAAAEKVFISWNAPCLPQVADWLKESHQKDGQLDLSRSLLVLPGSRAGRRLLELLVEGAEEEKLCLRPPAFVTPGALPETLTNAAGPFFSPLEERVLWQEVLSGSPNEVATAFSSVPQEEDFFAWFSLADHVLRLRKTLAAARGTFSAGAKVLRDMGYIEDEKRWLALAQVEEKYLAVAAELPQEDLLFSREKMLSQGVGDCSWEAIYLVATTDLSPFLKDFLVAAPVTPTAFIHAPKTHAAGFDCWGSVLADYWREQEVELAHSQLVVAHAAEDQAALLREALAEEGSEFLVSDVAIGVTEDAFVPFLERELHSQGYSARFAAGQSVQQTAPYRLLFAVEQYLLSRRLFDLLALFRHPDWSRALQEKCSTTDREQVGWASWLASFDRYQEERLQENVLALAGDDEGSKEVKATLAAAHEVLSCFDDKRRALPEWAEVMSRFLGAIYQSDANAAALSPQTGEVLSVFRDILSEVELLASYGKKKVSAAEGLRLVLREAESRSLPEESQGNAIDTLGWLELHLDDAPLTYICGINEGFLPALSSPDSFLNETIREKLSLGSLAQRFGRDVYLLAAKLASCPRAKLFLSQVDTSGEPLLPSQLLYRCSNAVLPERTLSVFCEASVPQREVISGKSSFLVPIPVEPLPEPPQKISVTGFADYLYCPYRYYLKHCLGLASVSDDHEELDARLFGTLAHEVLRRFGKSALKQSSAAEEIQAGLFAFTRGLFRERFGESPAPLVRLQQGMLERRWEAFSRLQAAWRESGWEIREVEKSFSGSISIDLPSGPMEVRGQIDRIDFHPQQETWAVFDYKFSNEPRDPKKTRSRSGDWRDLQLPLYERALRHLGFEGEVRLGYWNVCANLESMGHEFASWGEDDLQSAWDCACEVAQAVRDENFTEVSSWQRPFDDFAVLCGTGQLVGVEENS